MKEAGVQDSIQRYLKRFPCPIRVRKLSDSFTRGYPDLQVIFVRHGWLILLEVEVKRPTGGKLHALQKAERDDMLKTTAAAQHGAYVHCVARSVDDVKQALAAAGLGFTDEELKPCR